MNSIAKVFSVLMSTPVNYKNIKNAMSFPLGGAMETLDVQHTE